MKQFKRLKTVVAVTVLLALVLSVFSSFPAFAEEDPDTVYVSTFVDIMILANDCRYSDWSRGKTVVLTNSIDMNGVESFEGIPLFYGTFEGNGYVISGVRLSIEGDTAGFFRFLEQGAKVENLRLICNAASEDEDCIVGGLVGLNAGTVSNCIVGGTLTAKGVLGKIAGENATTGIITDCSAFGSVSSSQSVGGIVGINYGTVAGCTNTGSVNTDSSWLQEDDASSVILGEIGLSDYGSDIGGIAGHSSGILMNCVNNGKVGYPQAGKYVGGICGSQSGSIVGCENHGVVNGKTSVGGIVGLFVPEYNNADAEKLSDALDDLHDLIQKMIDDIDAGGDVLDGDLASLQDKAAELKEIVKSVGDETRSALETMIDATNELLERLEYVIHQMVDVLGNVEDAMKALSAIDTDIDALMKDADVESRMDGQSYDPTDYQALTLLPGAGGQLSSDNSNPSAGAEVTVTVIPEDGYELSMMMVRYADGTVKIVTPDASDGEYVFEMPSQNICIAASFAYKGQYIARSNAGGKVTIVDSGTSKKIEVKPDSGYTVESIKVGDNSVAFAWSSADSCYEAMAEKNDSGVPVYVTVEFAAVDAGHQIKVETGAGGSVTSDLSSAVSGTTVQLTVTENLNYELGSLTVTDTDGNGIAVTESSDGVWTFVMPDRKVFVRATFDYNTNLLTRVYAVSNAGGNVVVVPNIFTNKYVLTVTPDDGYLLSGTVITLTDGAGKTQDVTLDEMTAGTGYYTYTVSAGNYTAPVCAEVTFTRNPVATVLLSTTCSTGGSVMLNAVSGSDGEEISVLIYNDDHYYLSSLTVDGSDADENGVKYTDLVNNGLLKFTLRDNADSDVRVAAEFSPCVITYSASYGGTASYSISGKVITVTVTPSNGFIPSRVVLSNNDGKTIAMQRKSTDSYVYTLEITPEMKSGAWAVLSVSFEAEGGNAAVISTAGQVSENAGKLNDDMNKVAALYEDVRSLLTDDFGDVRLYSSLSESERTQLQKDMTDLLGTLSDAGSSATQLVSSVTAMSQMVAPYVTETYDALKKDLNNLSSDTGTLITAMDKSVTGLQTIFKYLDSLEKIRLQQFSDEYNANWDKMSTVIDGLSEEMTTLRKDFQNQSDAVEEDFRQINDRLNDISHIILDRIDTLNDIANGGDYIIDLSATEPDYALANKVTGCKNDGAVSGKQNVGGIVGAIDLVGGKSDADTDVTFTDLLYTHAILDGCENQGVIESRNNNVGGIVGDTECGYILNCISSGSATSESGYYIGGISGICEGTISRCLSMAELYGSSYVGGIAGKAGHVNNCLSMAYIMESCTRAGAIIGADEPEKDEKLSEYRSAMSERIYNNYYLGLSASLYGIDGISYNGIAEETYYDVLKTLDNYQELFKQFYIVFTDEDGNILSKQAFDYGEEVKDVQYPELTPPDSKYYVWSGYIPETMDRNVILTAVAYDIIPVLSSQESLNGKAYAFIFGKFTRTQELWADPSDEDVSMFVTEKSTAIARTLSVYESDLDEDELSSVRLLKEIEGKDVTLYVLENGKWTARETEEEGRYLSTVMTGSEMTYCIVYTDKAQIQPLTIGLIAGGAVLLLAAVITTIVIVKKKKRLKQSNPDK